MGGDPVQNPNGTYGTLGVADPANKPGGRGSPSWWYDTVTAKFYLFGGDGWGDAVSGVFDDLWSAEFGVAAPIAPLPPANPPVQVPVAAPVISAAIPVAAPIQIPDPILRVVITSTVSTRPNTTAICAGFMQYPNLSPSELSCIPEVATSAGNTTFYVLITMAGQPGRSAYDQLQSNTSYQSSFLATIGTSTAGAYTGLNLQFNPSIGRACLYPQPVAGVCDSPRGARVIDRSVTVTSSTSYTFITPTEVRGDFTSGPNSTVILSYQSTSLTITGCAKFEGNLVLSGPPLVVSTNTSYVLATFAGLCPATVPGEPQTKFSSVTWDTPPRAERVCQSVSTTPVYGTTQLSVLVTVDSSGCAGDAVAGLSTGATAGIAVGVIALVLIVIVAVVVYRMYFKPRSMLDQQEMALAAEDKDITAAGASGTTTASSTGAGTTSGKSKKGKKKGETEYAAINIDQFNAEREEGSAHIVSIPASDVKMLQRLGAGAYGDVWLGSMPDGAFVAVKRMKNTVLASHAAAFFSEASIMMQVTDNPHVVQMYGMIADEGEYGLVMEFMPGGSLDKYLSQLKSKMPTDVLPTAEPAYVVKNESRLYDLAYSIAAGLSCLASNGIVHRDLSARNILLD
eukprot:TRINITY_DN2839_c0_g1_i2.p1 TRINITY_DN2839_c0_g1~~TRINITY_DN2839_c0_g1_i2.p1  ORF type:complete len:624 (+),score=86.59 TRINITY_DN2839_c0_g1_i2:1093-2964(+)